MLLLLWSVVFLVALALYLRQVYSRFSAYGVKTFEPVPLFGNMLRITTRLEHFAEQVEKLYNAFPEERFVGRFEFLNPMVVVRDIELIKMIAVKDFEYFLDHRSFVDEKYDPFFGRNLFSLKGQEWKDMRSTLSPAFTSSKIRLMVPFMEEVGELMIKSLKEKARSSKNGYIDIDCKDLTTRYANDVIASCAFGLKVDSHSDQNNMFYQMGKVASTFNYKQLLKFFALTSWPNISKVLKISLFTESTKKFFWDLVMNTMSDRETKNIVRPDMIHLLMEAKKGQLTHEKKGVVDTDAGFATVEESSVGKEKIDRVWSDIDLVAQAVLFFIAGFETISSAMSFALHELAVHPDIQEKLYQEIKENETKCGGKLDYNAIQNMTYLDMVVSEVLRIWPPAIALDRLCTKDYNLGKPNKDSTQDYVVRKGESLMIPVWAIHRDPNFYPEPEKFDPERFSEENKLLIKPFTYAPFGLGPRNCIGSRFALCEVKVMIYQLLLHMELSPCERTCIPAKLSTETFNIRIKGGHWLRFKQRQQ
ncbi:cytochrome P450 9e2-like [Battus philenor]|uniref:cytochrome P450 9e2-like n=1 Tax=Battus philenor TaxID=42288 RepID=UPI0035CFD50F